jgi:hypothetical protein
MEIKEKYSHYRRMGSSGSGSLGFPDSVTSAFEGCMLSALRTSRIYPQEYPGTRFKMLNRPQAHEIAEKIPK